jgi:hypothetical protein
MPLDTSFQHPPSASARDRMEHRQTVAGGSSPFYDDEPRPAPLDTGITASCTCCSPPRRFVGTAGKTAEEWLTRHVERAAVDREQANASRRQTYAKQKSKV